ncbi:MAG: type II toxin-antitoxin system RelE/ParE family toxin [Candidatus Lambdaproteobacteria bacterium]|nr:type II toxin-antitoxin system RelE/ParE family toxin [Candidatus Lambdaproteobacteria bacterium]
MSSVYEVVYVRTAERDLRKLTRTNQQRVARAVKALATEPRPPGCRRLQTADVRYRIRVGDLRIVYRVEDERLLVLVIRIDRRDRVYRRVP